MESVGSHPFILQLACRNALWLMAVHADGTTFKNRSCRLLVSRDGAGEFTSNRFEVSSVRCFATTRIGRGFSTLWWRRRNSLACGKQSNGWRLSLEPALRSTKDWNSFVNCHESSVDPLDHLRRLTDEG